MPRVALTDRFCSGAKAIGDRTDYFDEKATGLALRVTAQGHRTWSFVFTSPVNRKRARLTLGTYPATSLAAARARAIEARAQSEAGQDPRRRIGAQSLAEITFGGTLQAYLGDPEKMQLRSIAEVQRRMRRNVLPVIGSTKLLELRKRDVRTVTDQILRRGKRVEATRVFEDVRAVVRWAVANEYLDANPLDGMGKPAPPHHRDRVLSDQELAILWNRLPIALRRSEQCQLILKLCLVTAQRIGEVAGIREQEVDLSAREWRLPASRTKNGHAHVVPLSTLSLELLAEAKLRNKDQSGFFFPCGSSSLAASAVARSILRAHERTDEEPAGRFQISPWSAHDLRRTAITGMARLGIAPIVLGHIANHRTVTRAGVTLAVYSQYAYEREKRTAMDLWSTHLQSVIRSAELTTSEGESV